MIDPVEIAYTKKEAELNIWLDEVFAGQMMTAKMLFLFGMAAKLDQVPEIESQLSDRAKAFMPSRTMANDFIVEGAEVWGAFYDGLYTLISVRASYDAGGIDQATALAAIDGIQPSLTTE
jgi:hypothetical protein